MLVVLLTLPADCAGFFFAELVPGPRPVALLAARLLSPFSGALSGVFTALVDVLGEAIVAGDEGAGTAGCEALAAEDDADGDAGTNSVADGADNAGAVAAAWA